MSGMELASVAAVADNGVIGNGGDIPWPTIERDQRQYRERVADDPVIMGRKTFEQMAHNLPGSAQVVLSRSRDSFDAETAHHASSVEEATSIVETLGADVAYVIGGGAIYDLFQPHVDRMFLSRVPGEYEGDSVYPDWDPEEWTLVDETEYERYTLQEWERDG